MISARKRYANRANARASTGPRTAAGKAKMARNARRHGLWVPVLRDPALMPEVEALARLIAGNDIDAQRQEAARRIAEAQIDLVRVRRARRELQPVASRNSAAFAQLVVLDRYERRALARRKFAIRDFDAAGLGQVPQAPARVRPPIKSREEAGDDDLLRSLRRIVGLPGWAARACPGKSLPRTCSGVDTGLPKRTCADAHGFGRTEPTGES